MQLQQVSAIRGLEELGIDGRIILKWKELRKQDVRMWTGFVWLRIGSTGGIL
jgi:hypothetical protein